MAVRSEPSVLIDLGGRVPLVRLQGDWTTQSLVDVEADLSRVDWPTESEMTLDATGIVRLDTGGALSLHNLLDRLDQEGRLVRFEGLQPRYAALLEFVRGRQAGLGPVPIEGRRTIPERVGRATFDRLFQGASLISFVGEVTTAFFRTILRPQHIRWRATVSVVQAAGVQALPIIGLLSFLLGVVIAYQGGVQLQQYGANIFVVELVTVTMVREMGPLITAIIVAGRSGSAYTAEIGTMRVTEEIDALRTIGIAPMDLLVLPKVLGLIIAMPLLTLYACALGVFGGMVMAETQLGVSFRDFFERIPKAVTVESFAAGIGKAPAFAAIVAIVGCFQGFRVSGGADAVGRQTTVSVVQAIFLVIVADAGFSILFSVVGI